MQKYYFGYLNERGILRKTRNTMASRDEKNFVGQGARRKTDNATSKRLSPIPEEEQAKVNSQSYSNKTQGEQNSQFKVSPLYSRDSLFQKKNTSEMMSTLERLENEDVEDRYSRINYLNKTFVEVIDEELKEFFIDRQIDGDINGMIYPSKNFTYVGKDKKLYRTPNNKKVEDDDKLLGIEIVKPILTKSLLDDVVNSINVKDKTGTKPKVLTPTQAWKSNIYSEIMAGKNSEGSDTDEENFSWVEDRMNKVEKKKDKSSKSTHFSIKDLNYIEKDISAIKSAEFAKLKDSYTSLFTSLQMTKNQLKLSEPRYYKELASNDQDKDFIKGHVSLNETSADLEKRLRDLKAKIQNLVTKKSPYSYSDFKMPKFGNKDSFQTESVKLFPIVSSDEDISIKDLFTCLAEWAENEGLSESALKRAIFSRLRGPRAKSWLIYSKQPMKDAITSMIMLYDKMDSPLKYSNFIKNFKRNSDEDVQNSVGRLIHAINKYLEDRPIEEQKVIRKEILLSKLGIILSPRAYREIFRKLEQFQQLGSEISEKELLSAIYTEDMFDKRANMDNYLQINNISKDRDDVDNLCDKFEDLELSAIEHKRKPGDTLEAPIFRNKPDFKQAKTIQEPNLYRKVLEPKRTIPNYSNNKPIMVGRDNRSYVKIGNPNPNNRWHNRENYEQSNYPRYNYRKEYISSRNAPLQEQENTRYRSNDAEFNRYDNRYEQRNRFNNGSHYGNSSENDIRRSRFSYPNNFRGNYSSNYRPQRNSYGSNQSSYSDGSGLRHSMQIRSNPPAIFQQISYDQLNSLCVSAECKGEREHKVGQCPKMQVFQKAPFQRKNQ